MLMTLFGAHELIEIVQNIYEEVWVWS